MKNFILFLVVFILYCSNLFGVDFKFTPISLSFYSIEAQGDVLAAYGTSGSMFISYDNSISWDKVSLFDRGNIVKVFLAKEAISSFNDCGDYAFSTDNGKTWKVSSFISDSVFAVIKYPEGYFVRAKHQLILLDHNLKIKNSYNLFYTPTWRLNPDSNNKDYRNSIAYLNGKFIAVADSINKDNIANSTILLMFNDNFDLIDTIIPGKFGLCQNCYSSYKILTDSLYLYFHLEHQIYRTNDFKNWELTLEVSGYFGGYKLFDGKLFFYDIGWFLTAGLSIKLFQSNFPDSANKIIDMIHTQNSARRYINDFVINNKKAIFVGNNNFIFAINLIDSTTSFYSDFNVASVYSIPHRINDSTFMFVAKQFNGTPIPYIYLSKDKGITFFPTLDTTNYFLNDFIKPYGYLFNYFDPETNKTYFIGSNNWYTFKDKGAFISDDLCKTFHFKKIDIPSNNNPLSKSLPNIQKVGNNLVYSVNTLGIKSYVFTYTISSDIENLCTFIDSNFVVNYVFSKDTNTYLFHGINTSDTTNEIKYTSDKGENWTILKKYSKQDSLLFYKEVSYKNVLYLFGVSVSKEDSVVTIDVIDLNNRLLTSLYTCKAKGYLWSNKLYFEEYLAICSDSNYIYLANNDTIFYISNIYDFSKSQYHLLPSKGKIWRTFSKIDNVFYAFYEDSVKPRALYWIDTLSSPTSAIETPEIEDDNYLYFYPPFPLPSHGYVRALLYWDLNSNPDDFIITIFNINGIKVAENGDIAFERISNYSGYILWDGNNMEKGIYFINIKNKKLSNTIKIILN